MSTPLFGRVVEITTGAVKMNNTSLDIEFEVPFDDDLAPNLSTISVYNLSKNTISQLNKGQKFSLVAGYLADKGLILEGEIASHSTKRVGTDKLTTIKVLDSVPFKANKTLQKAYKKAIKADALIKDLAKALGLKIAVLKLPLNKVYKKGYSINGEIIKEIQKIAKDCGVSCYINKGQTYIRPLRDGDNHNFILNSNTGLIGSPEYFEKEINKAQAKGYKVKSLLQYRMNTASIIKIDAVEVKASVRVQKGKHTFKGDTFYTEVEAIL
ncbi:hypothetical protein NSQ62_14375 [Solibacillus sp. FSL H8-0523]|uniref:phage protein n=1 Tax=Solibacillus sp. FSL H8-0523 TaxID=2954511 RepID=UPI003101AE03